MDEWGKWVLTIIGGGWLGSLTWMWNRQVKRIDGKAGKDDLAAILKRVDEHLADDKAMHALMYAEVKQLSVSMARLEGAVNGLPKKDT